MINSKILVIGKTGQVASHLHRILPGATYWDRCMIDWEKTDNAAQKIIDFAPSHIVNAVAYTAVDKAEDEPESAWEVNVEAPKKIAMAANKLSVPLLHFSTDYVFDGISNTPYKCSSPVNPKSIYGKTKYAGELAVATHCKKYWIIRASWVFSEHGTNFVKTMLHLFTNKKKIAVVSDQFGKPTYAGDIAKLCKALLDVDQLPSGTYHFSGGSSLSWYQFACSIAEMAKELGLLKDLPAIAPIPSSEYPTKAPRPQNSILMGSSTLAELDNGEGDWCEGLKLTLEALSSKL